MTNNHSNPFPILTTERLLLRQLLESDVEEIFSLRSNKAINKYLGRQPSKTLDDALTFIKNINENIKNSDLKYWAITFKNSNKLIGTICLFGPSDDLKECEIGYEMLADFQGQGLMVEASRKIIDYAFQTLGLHAVTAFTHKDNQSSTKLLEKLDFEKAKIMDETNKDFIIFRLTNQ